MPIEVDEADDDKGTLRDWLLAPITVPLALLAMFLLAIVMAPYWWLYPENQMHEGDLSPNEAEQARLAAWRAERRKQTFWQRLGKAVRGDRC